MPTADIRAELGAIAPKNGQMIFAGGFTGDFDFGVSQVPLTVNFTNFYVATLDPAQTPLAAVAVNTFNAPTSAVTHLVATADGGSVVAFSGGGLNATEDPIESQQDQGSRDALILKLSDKGALEWSLLVEGVGGDLLVSMLQATPNGILIGGTNTTADIVFKLQNVGTEGTSDNIIVPPGLFLFEIGLDGAGLKAKAKTIAGNGNIVAVRDHEEHRFIFGGYTNVFPAFGGIMPVNESDQQALFVVKLDANDNVVSKKAFGFDTRANTPAGMVDTGDGFVLFATTGGPNTGEALFRGSSKTIPDGTQVGVIAKVDYDNTIQWVETDQLDSFGGTTMHSVGLSNEGELLYGYRLGAPNSSVTFEAMPFSQTDTDTVFVRRSPTDGTFRGALPTTTPDSSTRIDMTLSSGPCGELAVGSYNEDASLGTHDYDGESGKIRAVVDLFPGGLPFP